MSRTSVPLSNCATHVAPQSMPAGSDFTPPEPLMATINRGFPALLSNVAVTDESLASDTSQEADPEQAPLQPKKCEPASATASSLMGEPATPTAEQVPGQATVPSARRTLPFPEPAIAMERVNF